MCIRDSSEYEYHINRENGLISHQILYTSNGSGILHIGGETYRLSKGSLFYMAPEIPHEYYPENGDWTTCWIVFRGKYLKELMKELGFGDYLINENPDCELLNQLFGMIFSAASDPVSGAQKCSLLVYEYLLESRRQLVNNAFTAASGSAIGNAVAYINIKYKEDITLNQLCEISGYSHQHFCRLFKAQKMCIRDSSSLLSLIPPSAYTGICTFSHISFKNSVPLGKSPALQSVGNI